MTAHVLSQVVLPVGIFQKLIFVLAQEGREAGRSATTCRRVIHLCELKQKIEVVIVLHFMGIGAARIYAIAEQGTKAQF